MKGYLKIVGVLAVALVLVSVAMLNADQQVTLTLVPGLVLPAMPVFVIILLAMLGGVLVAAAVSVPGQLRRGLQVRELRRRIARLEAERPAADPAPASSPEPPTSAVDSAAPASPDLTPADVPASDPVSHDAAPTQAGRSRRGDIDDPAD